MKMSIYMIGLKVSMKWCSWHTVYNQYIKPLFLQGWKGIMKGGIMGIIGPSDSANIRVTTSYQVPSTIARNVAWSSSINIERSNLCSWLIYSVTMSWCANHFITHWSFVLGEVTLREIAWFEMKTWAGCSVHSRCSLQVAWILSAGNKRQSRTQLDLTWLGLSGVICKSLLHMSDK